MTAAIPASNLAAESLANVVEPSSDVASGPRICILGGGFGGLYTALRLGQFPWDEVGSPEITLVDRSDRFVFLPLLYELVTEEMEDWEVAPRFEELLGETSVRFCQGAVTNVHLNDKKVEVQRTTGAAETLKWDRLVLALGGETPLDGVPGAADYALPFRSIADAYRLKKRLKTLEQSRSQGEGENPIRVAIVGGGYSGVELACKVSDRLGSQGRVRIIEQSDQILRFSAQFNQTTAEQALRDRNIWIDVETTVTAIGEDFIEVEYHQQSDRLTVDLVLWTIGNRVVPVVNQLELPRNNRQQICTEPTLQVQGSPEIYALGDLADGTDAAGQSIPKTAQAAFQQADYAAWNIWADLHQERNIDRPLLPFRYQHLGEMMALGLEDATLSGLGVNLSGPFAHLVRRLVYLQRMPTWEHQLKVGLSWITRPLMQS